MILTQKYKSIDHKDNNKLILVLIYIFISFFFIHEGSAQIRNLADPKQSDDSQKIAQLNNPRTNSNKVLSTEKEYRKTLSKNQDNIPANYNLGNHLYKNGYVDEALPKYKNTIKRAKNKSEKHKAYHNIGNIYMNNELYDKAANAYLKALINNPNDEETRYNYVLAKSLIKKQKNLGGEDDKKKDQEEKNDENKKKKDQEDKNDQKQDQEDKNQENKDKNDNQSKEKDEENQNNKEKEDNKKKQSQLSPNQVKHLLEAMDKEEQKVQEKMNQGLIKGSPIKSEKDW